MAEPLSPTKIIRRNFANGDLKVGADAIDTEPRTKAKHDAFCTLSVKGVSTPFSVSPRPFPARFPFVPRDGKAVPGDTLGCDKCADNLGKLQAQTLLRGFARQAPARGTAIFGGRTKKQKLKFLFFVGGACAPAKIKPRQKNLSLKGVSPLARGDPYSRFP